MSAASLTPNRESASWETLTPASRKLVAAAAGFTNVHQQARIGASAWADLYDHERKALYGVNWRNVIARQERKR